MLENIQSIIHRNPNLKTKEIRACRKIKVAKGSIIYIYTYVCMFIYVHACMCRSLYVSFFYFSIFHASLFHLDYMMLISKSLWKLLLLYIQVGGVIFVVLYPHWIALSRPVSRLNMNFEDRINIIYVFKFPRAFHVSSTSDSRGII